jgi:hypothetical protein
LCARPKAALADLVEHIEQVSRASRQPIESGDHEHVVLFEPADDLGQFRAIGLGAAGLLSKHLGAPRGPQLRVLRT